MRCWFRLSLWNLANMPTITFKQPKVLRKFLTAVLI